MYHIIFIIRLFSLFTNLYLVNNLKLMKAQIIQTRIQAKISSGQCTQTITLDITIKIPKGRKI